MPLFDFSCWREYDKKTADQAADEFLILLNGNHLPLNKRLTKTPPFEVAFFIEGGTSALAVVLISRINSALKYRRFAGH